MSKICPLAILLIFALSSCANIHTEPDWFRYMENARAACKDSDFIHSDEWLNKAKAEAKKYNMNPPCYAAAPAASPHSMPGELATLADMYRKRERYEKAEELCDLAITIVANPEYKCLLAEIYDGKGKHEDAEKILSQLLAEQEKKYTSQDKQKYWQAVYVPMQTLAHHYVEMNKLDKAEDLYSRALDLTEKAYPKADISEQLATLGKIELKLGKKEKAQKYFERFLSIESKDKQELPEVSALLSNVYADADKDAEADALYKKALQDPSVFNPSPTAEEVACRHKYAELLKKLNRPEESKKMEVSARNMEAVLGSNPEQKKENWKKPTVYQ